MSGIEASTERHWLGALVVGAAVGVILVCKWANVHSIPASCSVRRKGEWKQIVGQMSQAALRQELAALIADSRIGDGALAPAFPVMRSGSRGREE